MPKIQIHQNIDKNCPRAYFVISNRNVQLITDLIPFFSYFLRYVANYLMTEMFE